MKDPYQVLGVPRDASADAIRDAYRKLAKRNHPDLNPGDKAAEARFKEISAANDLLSDPEKRGRFDRGEIDASGAEQAPRGFYRDFGDRQAGAKYGFESFDMDEMGDLGSIFGRAFRGGRAGAGMRARGADLQYRLDLDFVDAVRGTEKRITLPERGQIDVRVPPGTEDGQVLRLRGQGRPGVGDAPAGDALIEIRIRPHEIFRRVGDAIHADLTIGIRDAVLGGSVEAPTIDGPVRVKVPRHSNQGTVLRLRGKGVPHKDGTRGDQYVILQLAIENPADAALEKFLTDWHPTNAGSAKTEAG